MSYWVQNSCDLPVKKHFWKKKQFFYSEKTKTKLKCLHYSYNFIKINLSSLALVLYSFFTHFFSLFLVQVIWFYFQKHLIISCFDAPNVAIYYNIIERSMEATLENMWCIIRRYTEYMCVCVCIIAVYIAWYVKKHGGFQPIFVNNSVNRASPIIRIESN